MGLHLHQKRPHGHLISTLLPRTIPKSCTCIYTTSSATGVAPAEQRGAERAEKLPLHLLWSAPAITRQGKRSFGATIKEIFLRWYLLLEVGTTWIQPLVIRLLRKSYHVPPRLRHQPTSPCSCSTVDQNNSETVLLVSIVVKTKPLSPLSQPFVKT